MSFLKDKKWGELFPTPDSILSKMLSQPPVKERLYKGTVLDPSAGTGSILEYVLKHKEYYRRLEASDLYAIELNPELQVMLAGKGFRVLGSDFLVFDEPYTFTTILMNPPWSNGDDHLLHAWELLAAGGVVACILNAETIRNPFSAARKVILQLVASYGYTVDLGSAFKQAERSTDVPAILVVLIKPEHEQSFLKDVPLESDNFIEDVLPDNALARADWIQALIDRYNAALQAIQQRHKLLQSLNQYTQGIGKPLESTSLNVQIQQLKEAFWHYVLNKTLVSDKATSAFKQEFETRRSQQANMAFTYENIEMVLDTISQNYGSMMQQCIVDVFDLITKYHKKNTIYIEGWVTNKAHRINKKIIHPHGCKYEPKWSSWSTYDHEFFNDLDKACCVLSGLKFENLRRPYSRTEPLPSQTIVDALDDHHRHLTGHWSDEFESHFFKLRCFKKGTVHLVFKDEDLWKQFNQVACQGKGWLGNGA